MKVAIVCQHFDSVLPPWQNSIGIWTHEVGRRLPADCEVTVIARRPRGHAPQVDVEGLRLDLVSCLPGRVWSSRVWSRAFPWAGPLFAQPIYALDFVMQAGRVLRRLKPDVVHLQNFPHHAPAMRRAAPDAAIVLHMHCDWLVQLDNDTMRRGVAAVDVVAGCSGHVVEPARARFAAMGTHFAVLPNGAPVERLAGAPQQRSPRRVLFVGRLSPEKGVHTLVEAWPKIVQTIPEAHLEIVGPSGETPREFLIDLSDDPDVAALGRFYRGGSGYAGSYEVALKSMLPAHLIDTVTFAGPQPYDSVIERCGASAVLVNPSLSESFGMSLVEALAAGTPIVATRVGGMPEIVKATGGGVLVGKNDPEALAEAVIGLLSAPSNAAQMGRRGSERVAELYAWARIAQLTRDLYDQALSVRRGRRT